MTVEEFVGKVVDRMVEGYCGNPLCNNQSPFKKNLQSFYISFELDTTFDVSDNNDGRMFCWFYILYYFIVFLVRNA